jgi:CheY-like chemotaxis protein
VVEDNGIGMAGEVLEKAMDPFYTTKEVGKGTGLGLSMAYTTVTAHHGQMEIQSEPSQGTCVRMRFPASMSVPKAPEPVAEPRVEKPQGALNVLLVDDDELIQGSSRVMLGTFGHTVTIASNGEEALTILEGGFQPDVVILDMNMPGMGGTGTLPRLRAINPTVPVLLATGQVDQVAKDLVAAHPHTTLLPKPYSMGELKQHLEEALKQG